MLSRRNETPAPRANQAGFTLVELLVVMLILGLLVALAIPSFFNQADKADDAEAKATARTAQVAIEAYSTENGGRYTDADEAALHTIEPVLPNGAPLAVSGAGGRTYTLTVTSETDTAFSISRSNLGDLTYECSVENTGGCPDDGEWG